MKSATKLAVCTAAMLLVLALFGCTSSNSSSNNSSESKSDAPAEQTDDAANSQDDVAAPDQSDAKEGETSDGVSADIKDFCDEYLAFINDYCELLKKSYTTGAAGAASAAMDLAKQSLELADWELKLEEIDRDELSSADLAYLLETEAEATRLLEEAGE